MNFFSGIDSPSLETSAHQISGRSDEKKTLLYDSITFIIYEMMKVKNKNEPHPEFAWGPFFMTSSTSNGEKKIKNRNKIPKICRRVVQLISNNFSIGPNLIGPSVWPPLAPHVLVT